MAVTQKYLQGLKNRDALFAIADYNIGEVSRYWRIRQINHIFRSMKITLPTQFNLYPSKQNVHNQKLSASPTVSVFHQVLNIPDCAYLIFKSRSHMKPADVIFPHGNIAGVSSNVSTNTSTYLPFDMVDIISRYAELKIVGETDENLTNSEPMSILHYAPGQYYRPHVDYFSPNIDVSAQLLADGGQRTVSTITYLTAPIEGGGTSFPRLNIQIPPIVGNTLWLKNCLGNGEPDPRSLHAGDPVGRGEKWVITKWFREKPTQYLAN